MTVTGKTAWSARAMALEVRASSLHSPLPRSLAPDRPINMTAHFIYTGFRTDVPKLLAAMDVVVLAIHYESFGLAPLEATVNGRPVVAGNV